MKFSQMPPSTVLKDDDRVIIYSPSETNPDLQNRSISGEVLIDQILSLVENPTPIDPTVVTVKRAISVFCPGKPAAGGFITRVYLPGSLTIQTTGHRASSNVAPTVSHVLQIELAGMSIGTITWTAGVAAGVVQIPEIKQVQEGNLLIVRAPETVDATWADISIGIFANSSST